MVNTLVNTEIYNSLITCDTSEHPKLIAIVFLYLSTVFAVWTNTNEYLYLLMVILERENIAIFSLMVLPFALEEF